jgi:hypothetical protein
MVGACSAHGEKRKVYKIFLGNPDGNKRLGRPRRGWQDNIKMGLRKIGLEDVNWIHLVNDRDRWRAPVITIMNLRDPQKPGILLIS